MPLPDPPQYLIRYNMSTRKSPFKFLDPYTVEDREIYFGFDREIDEIYHRLTESRLMVVYGESGTGKSSLINCGLMSKLRDDEYLPIFIRRFDNILESISGAIRRVLAKPLTYQLLTAQLFKKALQTLSLECGKSILIILDQFEELFVFGTREEKQGLVQVIKTVVESDVDCRFLFVIREEYLANIAEFEKYIPNFLSNRARIERMDRVNAPDAINGPCRIVDIPVQEGFAEKLLEKLNHDKPGVDLPYMQLFLDKVFNLAVNSGRKPLSFTIDLIDKTGDVSDLLGDFLDEQISKLGDPDTAFVILKSFVSYKGTKRQLNASEVNDYSNALGKPVREKEVLEIIRRLVQLRILSDKNENGSYELRHDALAAKIFEKISSSEKEILQVRQFIENAYYFWKKNGLLLSEEELNYIEPFEKRLSLSEDLTNLVSLSRERVNATRTRKRNSVLYGSIIIIVFLTGFSAWALRERNRVRDLHVKVLAEKYNYLATILSATDPTKGLRLAEYALSLDTGNKIIKQNILSIYSDNNLCSAVEEQSGIIYSVAFSPDNSKVLTGSEDGILRLWDPKANSIVSFNGHPSNITSVAFSPDGRKILSASFDGTAKLWSLTGKQLLILKGHNNVVSSAAFSPDGRNIITGSLDNTARLWDLKGNTIHIFKGHKDGVTSVAFSPDGKMILTGAMDKTARLWDLSGNELAVLRGHFQKVTSVAFSADGLKLLTGSQDRTAILWNRRGAVEKKYQCANGIQSVAFSPDGQVILTGTDGGSVQLWDLDENELETFKGHNAAVNSVVFSHDGKKILTGSADHEARIWDLPGTFTRVYKGKLHGAVCIDYSPVSRKIINGSIDQKIRIWDLNGKMISTIASCDTTLISDIAFSPDGSKYLTISPDNTLSLWDINGNKIKDFHGHTKRISAIDFSPDGKRIISGGGDKTVRLWDLEDNSNKVFTGHTAEVNSVAFSPDGRKIVSGSNDNTAQLRDIDNNTLTILKGHSALVRSVAFSPDGKSILTGSNDQTARLWDLKGKMINVFTGHLNNVNYVAFSPDGKYILTGSEDLTARLWDLQGNIIQTFRGGNASIAKVLFLDDGKKILTASNDFLVRIFPVKIPYQAFKESGQYEELSAGDKLKCGIYQFKDVIRSDDESELLQAADYYSAAGTRQIMEEKIKSFDSAFGLFKKLAEKFPDNKYGYGNLRTLCWSFLLEKQFAKALDGMQICWAADSINYQTIAYMSMAYILNDRYDNAKRIIEKYKNDKWSILPGERTFGDGFLYEMNLLEDNDISHPDFDRARDLIKK